MFRTASTGARYERRKKKIRRKNGWMNERTILKRREAHTKTDSMRHSLECGKTNNNHELLCVFCRREISSLPQNSFLDLALAVVFEERDAF